MAVEIPPLPPGFKLDSLPVPETPPAQANGVPPLPPGFTLDEPTAPEAEPPLADLIPEEGTFYLDDAGNVQVSLWESLKESLGSGADFGTVAKRLPGNIADSLGAQTTQMGAGTAEQFQEHRASLAEDLIDGNLTPATAVQYQYGLQPEDPEALRESAARHAAVAAEARAGAQEAIPEDAGIIEKALQQGGSSSALTLPTVLATGPVGASLLLGTGAAGSRYSELRDEGIPEDQATKSGLLLGGLEGITELFPARALVKNIPGFRKRIVEFLATELPGENVVSVANMVDDITQGMRDDITWGELVESVRDTSLATLAGGGMQAGAAHLAQGRQPEQAEPETPEPETITAAELTEVAAERIAELEEAANPEDSDELAWLRENAGSPEALAEALGVRLEDATFEDVAQPAQPPALPAPVIEVDAEGQAGTPAQREAAAAEQATLAEELGLTPDVIRAATAQAERESQRAQEPLAMSEAAPVPPIEQEQRSERIPEPTAPDITADFERVVPPTEELIQREDVREEVERLKGESGWDTIGGRMIRKTEDRDSIDYKEVVGRTQWLPRADWWPDRPGGFNEAQTERIIDRGLAGERLGSKQKEYFDYLVDVARERADLANYVPDDFDMQSESLGGMDDYFEAAYVARELETNEEAIERLAIRYENNDAAFLRAVKALHDTGTSVDERSPESGRAPRSAETGDIFGDDTRTAQEVADETRRRDARRDTGQESVETGDPSDLFSDARKQRDIEDAPSSEGVEVEELSPESLTPEQRQAFEGIEQRKAEVAAETELETQLTEQAASEGQRAAQDSGMTDAVNALFKGAKNAPAVEFVQGLEGVPAALRKRVKRSKGTRTEGLYDPKTNRVFILTDSVTTPERAKWVAAHEIAGHLGLHGVFKTREGKARLDAELTRTRQNSTVRALADAIRKQRSALNESRSTEEAIAELSAAVRTGDFAEIETRYGVKVPEAQRSTVRAMIERFIQRIKKLFGKGEAFNDADVRKLIEDSWRYVREGESEVGGSTDVAAEQPFDDMRLTELPDDVVLEIDESADGEQFTIRAVGQAVGEEELGRMALGLRKRLRRLEIQESHVEAHQRNRGIGQSLIRRAYQIADERGWTLVSDGIVSQAQLRTYESLRRQGWTIAYAKPKDVRLVLEHGGNVDLGPDVPVVKRIEPPADADIALSEAPKKPTRKFTPPKKQAAPQAAPAPKPGSAGASMGWNFDENRWEGRKGQRRRARAELQDKMLSWRDAQENIAEKLGEAIPDAQNVYRLETLMHGRVKEGLDKLEESQIEPLAKALAKSGIDPATLEEYLYARHAKERNAQIAEINPQMPDGGSGMTNAQADAILKKLTPQKAKLDALAKRVDAMIRSTRRRLLARGLITQEQFDAMESQYQSYVPLRGKQTGENDFADTGPGAGRGIDTRQRPVKQALGRGEGNRAVNILGEIIGDAQRSVIQSEKARVGRAAKRLIEANPNPKLWQVEPVQTERRLDANGEVYEAVVNDWSDPSIIAVRENGKLYKIQVNHVQLAKALNHVGVEHLGAMFRIAGALNRYFSAILTRYNPAFIPVNASRDAVFGLTGLASEHGEIVAIRAAAYYPLAVRAAWRQSRRKAVKSKADQYAKDFAEDGGKTGYVHMPSIEDLQRQIGRGKLGGYSPAGARKAASALIDVVSAANDSVENGLRLSAYVTLRERGMSREASAEYAKNMTVNFNRKGFSGTKLNALFLFYNASIQGAKRSIDLMRRPKTWGYIGSLAGMQVAAVMYAMGQEDDEGEPIWNKVPEWVKQRNLVFTWLDDEGEQQIFTIPMPYGFNVFTWLSGRTSSAMLQPGDRPQDGAANIAAETISTLSQSFSPVPLDDGTLGLVPTALRIPLSVQTNRDDFGHDIRRENPFGKFDVPRSTIGRPDTLEIFKLASKGMNRIGGGDDYTPPPLSFFDVAPEDIEYLVEKFTGGIGRFVVDTATLGQKLAGDAPITPQDVPITSRFMSVVDDAAAQQSLFYDRREVIERDADRIRDVAENDGIDAALDLLKATPSLSGARFQRYKRGNPKEGKAPGDVILVNGRPRFKADPGSLYALYKAATDTVSTKNEAIRNAYTGAPPSLLPDVKRDNEIRALTKDRTESQKRFNAKWNAEVVGK